MANGNGNDVSESWHLDKRVPVALITTILTQFALTIWLASAMASDISSLKLNDARQDTTIETLRTAANAQAVQLGRIEEISLSTQRSVDAIARRLEMGP